MTTGKRIQTLRKERNMTQQELAVEIVKTYLSTDFEGGRHQRRVEKIDCK